uniref:Uncharacterized protein n=1 Tax=Avena sativa TaxID=4498 RepID=A0ACD5VE13_AVESA
MTNHFNMPFAPFIGINRHGQSFMLGCGFLRDEKEESFKWLFREFLKAMHGKQPTNIITDQDWAMRAAISSVFPDAVHRNCRWHVIKKANEKLGAFLGRNPGLAIEFNECIDESMTVEEFEAKWAELVLKWGLAAHETFAWLKKWAHTWVPCYFRHRFFPFMQSTQRSEGFNSVLKRYINPHNLIKHFVKQYEKIQEKMLGRESHADFRTEVLEVEPWSRFPIEKHALSIYTRDIYHRFRLEFELIGRYNVKLVGINMYLLVPNNQTCYPYGGRSYMVNANGGNDNYNCDCCKYERDGLLCCHVLKVFTHVGVDSIPERYILRRWTQQALEPVVQPVIPARDDVMPEESRMQLRFANLCTKFVNVAKIGSKSEQHEAIARRHIREMITEFAQLDKVKKRNTTSASKNSKSTSAPTAKRRANSGPTTTALVATATNFGNATAVTKKRKTTNSGPTPAAPTPPTSTRTTGWFKAEPSNMPPPSSTMAPIDQGHMVEPEEEAMVILDPPRSTTKGRKKGQFPSGIELQPKRVIACTLCNQLGHNSATCTSALGSGSLGKKF